MKLAQIAVRSRSNTAPAGIEFLEGTKVLLNDAGRVLVLALGPQGDEDEEEGSPKEEVGGPTLFLKDEHRPALPAGGSTDKASDLMDLGIKMLDRMEDVDPTVTAMCTALWLYHKVVGLKAWRRSRWSRGADSPPPPLTGPQNFDSSTRAPCFTWPT